MAFLGSTVSSSGLFWAKIPCLSPVAVGKNFGGRQEVVRLHWRGVGVGDSSDSPKLWFSAESFRFCKKENKKEVAYCSGKRGVGVQLNQKTSKLFSLSKSMPHASYLMTHAMSKLPITNRSSIMCCVESFASGDIQPHKQLVCDKLSSLHKGIFPKQTLLW